MNILVVGGAGYIGAHIVDLLCDQKNNHVIVLDNLVSGYKDNINSSADFIKGDILVDNDLDNIFKKFNIDAVIHLAAFKSVAESQIYTNKYTENNIIGSLKLIGAAINYNVKNFIFSSTAAVYGNPVSNPIDEQHPTKPINHYGFTKLYVENFLKHISKIKDIKYVNLRYFNAAGYTDKINLIKHKESNPQNLIPIVMEVAAKTRSDLEVFGGDYNTIDGTCIRDYIHVMDLADAHFRALQYLKNKSNESLTVNLSTGVGHSVLDVINEVQKVTNAKIKYKIVDRRFGDPSILISSNTLAKKQLNWTPNSSSLNKIISTMWKYYK